MFGCGAEKQERQPIASGIYSRVIHLLAHSSYPTQVVVLSEQLLKTAALFRPSDQLDLGLLQ
jgi:hypothetical protein